MNNLSSLFKAAADENRLRMLMLMLRHDELCVCDFMCAIGITQSKASRHLRYLYHAGFMKDRREGIWVHYRLSERLSPAHYAILEAVRETIPASVIMEMERRLSDREAEESCSLEERTATKRTRSE